MSDMNEMKKLLRSLLISAEHGVALKDLSRDFYDTVGYSLPYKRLGYASLEELLEDMPDTVRPSRDYTGQVRLFGVSNQDTEHIADMVKKQKKGTFNPYKPPPKAQGMQQIPRGGKRSSKPNYNYHHNNFHPPRSGPPRGHARSYTLPQNYYEVDTLSTSSYPDVNKPRHGHNYYKGPPPFRSTNNYHPKGAPYSEPRSHNTQQPFYEYSAQHKSPHYNSPTLFGAGIGSDFPSPNKNSHLLHATKEAIYDLLFQNPAGIAGKDIEEEYFRIFRTKLPYYKLGHKDVKEFIESIPDLVRIDYSNNIPVCFLAHRQEKQSLKPDYVESPEWKDFITPELFGTADKIKSNHSTSPKANSNPAKEPNTNLDLEDDSNSFVLTEDEKKRHLDELRSKICIFLISKGGPVPIDEFEHQYRALNREDPEIAYRLLGYGTLREFLRDLKDFLVFIIDSQDGAMSVALKTKDPSPPSPPRQPPGGYVNNHIRPRFPPANLIRPYPPQIQPVYRTTLPNSGFIPPGAPPPNIRSQRRPNNSNNHGLPRFPYNPRPPLPDNQGFLNITYDPPIPLRNDPPGFDPIPSSYIPISPLADSLLPPLSLSDLPDLASISLRTDTNPLKPFQTSDTRINSLSMDYGKAQRDFVQTQIASIADTRNEISLKMSSDPVLRFLEGSNVVLLAGEDQGKCALMSVALTHGLNLLTDNLQSLVICQDAKGVLKIFQCLETISDSTGLKVSCCDSPEKLKSFHTEPHVIVLPHTLLSEFLTKYDTSHLTRIAVYNLITDLNTYYEFVQTLKPSLSGQLSKLNFFFATSPHNDAGTFILKLINTLMVSKCIFFYYGKDQETCLTLFPHNVETSQAQKGSELVLRPRLLASLTSTREFPNHFDKYLIPLAATSSNFTILSNHMEEILLQQSLALIALKQVEPSTLTTQVAIVVPNEQQTKDFLELCEMGQSDGIKSLVVNSKTIKEDTRFAHICIGWPKEISNVSTSTRLLSKLSLVILFRVDLEQKFEYLENLFRNCLTPQIVVVGSNYSRQILKFESQFMSEPKHITFLAKDTY